MSAVAIVHDEPAFLERAAAALGGAGFDTVVFSDPMTALNMIEAARQFDAVVTRVNFSTGKPNGVSLALVLRSKYRDLKVVFVAKDDNETYTQGVGELIPHPVDFQKLVDAVGRALHMETAAN